ncbi:MAG: carbohydrate ABC transporter permease [Actinobacteria bacterium]|nr:carbohydrate ABC transporter permease [Actinomycetota bacterium]
MATRSMTEPAPLTAGQRPRRPAPSRLAKRIGRYTLLVVVAVVVLFPVYWMVLSTFQPEKYSLTYPPPFFLHGFNLGALTSLFEQQPIVAWLAHSLLVSVLAVVITVLLAVPGGYLLSRLRWRGSGVFGFLLLFTQIMPGAMIVVPELQFYRLLNWTNNLFALPAVYAAFTVPLGCWILKSAFDNVPGEVVEAAIVDGTSRIGVLLRILVPLSRPALTAVVVVAFFVSWNDYVFASAFITNRGLYTAGLGISTFISEEDIQLYQLQAAAVVFSLVPAALYMIVSRHIVRGLTAGAVK